ncbi:MAG: C40 family peptidase [Verrucomicrobiales bacterium]|jgi:cell wall-associated NlpC family hydrolase|nr:C40 family peptidase [Verrucomicrobiales bacterium]
MDVRYYFEQPEHLAALREEAAAWLGTPFRYGAAVRGAGGGTDCARMSYAIFTAIGATPAGKVFPSASADYTVHHADSPIDDFFRTELAAEFERLPVTADGAADSAIRAGDVLGFRIGKAVHHLAIVIDSGRMLQCVKPHGARLVSLQDSTFMKRLAVVYRRRGEQPL